MKARAVTPCSSGIRGGVSVRACLALQRRSGQYAAATAQAHNHDSTAHVMLQLSPAAGHQGAWRRSVQRHGGPEPIQAAPTGASTSSRLQSVLDHIDDINSKDPRSIMVDGKSVPYELAYSGWLTDWVTKLTADGNPAASEELMIVARGQHVQRWVMPRNSYPEGRTSYLKWREDLKKLHASTVTKIMGEAGYTEDSCKKVQTMILKKDLKEAENQIVEDALCLVFLERQFPEFRLKETEEKMVDIIRKTWKKMGEKGRAAALALAPSMGAEERALVEKALSG